MNDKAYIGAYVEPQLKADLQAIAKAEKRSLNSLLEIFLSTGVTHHNAKQKAMGAKPAKPGRRSA